MRNPELDGLRAIAVIPVLAFHAIPHRIPGGFLGVDLFFVLSGFLITSLLLREHEERARINLRAFYARRAWRILPPLVAAISLCALIAPGFRITPILLFYANFVPTKDLGALAHTWSLSVEEHFYLVWPVLFVVMRGWRRHGLLLLVFVALAMRLLLAEVTGNTLMRMDALAIGCLAAMVPLPRIGGAALGLLVVAFFIVPMKHPVMVTVGYTIAACVCAAAVANPPSFLAHPILQFIGRRSYGLYLYHLPIYVALDPLRADSFFNHVLLAALRFGVTFAVAELSYRTIERWSARKRAAIRS